jgi:hypothetical protein
VEEEEVEVVVEEVVEEARDKNLYFPFFILLIMRLKFKYI